MVSIYNLPWELVGQIGANLLPKWRCRLYICNKLWYSTCYSAEKWLFLWHMRNSHVLSKLKKIKYDIAEISRYNSISLRVNANGRYTFGEWWTSDWNRYGNNYYAECYIINATYFYKILDDYQTGAYKMNTFETSKYDYMVTLVEYNRYMMKKNNIYAYNLYSTMCHIHSYLSHNDLKNTLKAFGNDTYYSIKFDSAHKWKYQYKFL
jgi:hypothetical protein